MEIFLTVLAGALLFGGLGLGFALLLLDLEDHDDDDPPGGYGGGGGYSGSSTSIRLLTGGSIGGGI